MKIIDIIKKIFSIFFCVLGVLSFLFALIMITEDISGVLFGITMSMIFFFLGRGIIISYIENIKMKKEINSRVKVEMDAEREKIISTKVKLEVEKEIARNRTKQEKIKIKEEEKKNNSINNSYYTIEINFFWFYLWLVISVLCTIVSFGILFIMLIIPLYYYVVLKNSKYYYNDEKIIIETGFFIRDQIIIPLYKINSIRAQDNFLNFGTIYIKEKDRTIYLKYVNNSKNEMMELVEKWEKAKKENVRNEII